MSGACPETLNSSVSFPLFSVSNTSRRSSWSPGTSAAGPGRQHRLMRERLGAAASPAPHAAGSGPGRRLVGPRPPAAFACAERAPHARVAWARAAPWEPPRHVPAWGHGHRPCAAGCRAPRAGRAALGSRCRRLTRGARARIERLVVWPPLLLTQRAPARRASFAGAQRVGPSRLGRGAAGPRPPVLAVRRAEPLAGVVFGQASTHMMRTAW